MFMYYRYDQIKLDHFENSKHLDTEKDWQLVIGAEFFPKLIVMKEQATIQNIGDDLIHE